MDKRQLGPCVTFFPQPTTLISSVGTGGEVNLMTASWVGIVSKTPPTIGLSLHHGRLTYRQIRETGSFVVNLVPASLATEADFCGLRSGRDENKLEVTGLTAVPARHVAPPLLEESPLCLECRLTKEVELGDYRLLLGEILEIHAAEEAFRENASGDAGAFDPLVYLGGIREYWSLGEKVATAYQEGKKLIR